MDKFKTELVYENKESFESEKKSKLNIVHFNDVYNIESGVQEPCGGAARFLTLIEHLMKIEPTIILFSGDALSPSNISMIVQGKQMIEVLNKCHISCACLGNHDFDFGLDVLLKHISDSKFPWLLSNVYDFETRKPLGNVNDFEIVEANGLKIGIIGLVEQEWIATLSTISFDDIIYESYIDTGKRLANKLKIEDKCDFVIALTHMRWNNDTILAEKVPEIDIFLGGHDHDYVVKQINNKWVIKSGTDFREFSRIGISLNSDKTLCVDKIEKYIVNSEIEENSEIKSIVDSYLGSLNKELDVVLGKMNTELEGRFSFVRTKETNLGNFICDIMLAALDADCAFINSGSLRSDIIHPTGDFTVRDLKKILPYLDENVCISVKGFQLLKALENSVSQYPHHEGRFLQVSGIKFAFDPNLPSGQRVDPALIEIQDEYLELEKEYTVITKKYLHLGKDGFECLIDCPVLVDEENIPVLYNLVENHFKTIAKLKSNRNIQRFRSSIIPLFVVNRLINTLSEDSSIIEKANSSGLEKQFSQTSLNKLKFNNAAFLISKILSHKQKTLSKKDRVIIKQSEQFKTKVKEYEEPFMNLAPKLENRIVCIQNKEQYQALLIQKEINLNNKLIENSLDI